MDVPHEYPDLTVHLPLFHATIREGMPQKLEHNDIRWIAVGEIDQYAFCLADETILDKLRHEFMNILRREIPPWCSLFRHGRKGKHNEQFIGSSEV